MSVSLFAGIEEPKLEWAQKWLADVKKIYINGEWVDTSDNKLIASINPANGEVNGHFQAATERDVDLAVKAARAAFDEGPWRKVTRKERRYILQAIAEILKKYRAELATLEALDNGKLYKEAYNDDLQECIDFYEYYAGWTDKYYGENNPVEGDFVSFTTRDPVGVCGQILPFNYPLSMVAWKLAPAIAMGNTVVVKPSSLTSFSTIRFFELLDEADLFPKGVINLILGNGPIGSCISRHPLVDKISFTGSTKVGKMLVHDSADSNLKLVTLELGGKSPNIIFADAPNLDGAIERSFYGLFTHKGEKCSSPTRLFVQRPIYDEVVEKIAVYARNYKCGDPFHPDSDQGAQVSKAHMESILDYIESGKQEGARIVAGGERDMEGTNAKGCFVKPTVFADVHNKMRIAQEEIFGPVLSVIPFDTEEEVIRMANDTIYGLAAGLWTNDVARAHRVAKQLDAGMVFVNRYGCYDLASPFGGWKQSGWGKEYAIHSLQSYTRVKSIWISHEPV